MKITDVLTRVEGHAAVELVVKDGKVRDVKIRFTEGKRLFELVVKGKFYQEIPVIVSRICGICYVSHRLASIFAVEDAFGVEVPEEITLLRSLLVAGEFLESHATALYLFSLPDLFGYRSAVEMAKDYPEHVKRALRIREVGNHIMKTIGGKTIHGENTTVGGFYSLPERDAFKKIAHMLEEIMLDVRETVTLFRSLEYPDFSSCHDLELRLDAEGFWQFSDHLSLSDGRRFHKSHYEEFVVEEEVSYSTAKVSRIDGKPFLVGPLARVRGVSSSNPFNDDLARALELLYAAERGLAIAERFAFELPPVSKVEVRPKKGKGFGVKEAPRGVLYHSYAFDEDGRCVNANIITPTSQLQAVIGENLRLLARREPNLAYVEFRKRAESLVRAYDP